jgi:hypothetical protein
MVVDFIRNQFHVKLLGVHGESLGGMFACHLARTKQLNYLFADRTFSSLSDVAHFGFSRAVRFAFNLLNDWNYDSMEAYIETNCYKVIACDSKDEVLPYLSSLKVGVAQAVFAKEFSAEQKLDGS